MDENKIFHIALYIVQETWLQTRDSQKPTHKYGVIPIERDWRANLILNNEI